MKKSAILFLFFAQPIKPGIIDWIQEHNKIFAAVFSVATFAAVPQQNIIAKFDNYLEPYMINLLKMRFALYGSSYNLSGDETFKLKHKLSVAIFLMTKIATTTGVYFLTRYLLREDDSDDDVIRRSMKKNKNKSNQ